MKKCAVFSCMGLGDGLISLVLSKNLSLNGYEVTTFHPFLSQMQGWFPTLAIRKFPDLKELGGFDRFFIIYEKSAWMQEILSYCEKNHPEKTTVLNPIATPNTDYPYWEQGRFDGRQTFVENLYQFCRKQLGFSVVTKNNGIVVPVGVEPGRHGKRVIIHPTSSRPGKNWPQEKFLAVAERLKERGFQPVFILTEEEKRGFAVIEVPSFPGLGDLAAYVCESGYMIGNDSGIGHLASCLNLPTITLCRNRQTAQFWRPAWCRSEVLTPSSWIPNFKGLRLRDRHWKKWITVGRVVSSFTRLLA